MKKLVATLLFISILKLGYGQQEILPKDNIAFILFEKQDRNAILIPNYGKLHKFKIYRRISSNDEFKLVTEKKKPPVPLKDNVTPHGVTWQDPDYHTRDIEYKILAFDKKGKELGEVQVIWAEKK